jgi:hypothetical protein
MVTSVKQMIEAANAAVARITPQQARETFARWAGIGRTTAWNARTTSTV